MEVLLRKKDRNHATYTVLLPTTIVLAAVFNWLKPSYILVCSCYDDDVGHVLNVDATRDENKSFVSNCNTRINDVAESRRKGDCLGAEGPLGDGKPTSFLALGRQS